MWFIFWLIIFLLAAGLFARRVLRGASMQAFDIAPQASSHDSPPSSEHSWVLQRLDEIRASIQHQEGGNFLQRARQAMNQLGHEADLTDLDITNIDENLAGEPLRGEWIVPGNADPNKRLLYIHGGAFVVGSPMSHRTITTRLARDLKLAVFAVDYRMMPEHARLKGLTDCQNAYRWISENGPRGSAQANQLYIAGDSAGGNLTLTVLNWARNSGLAPTTAAIAICPLTDSTFDSPTWRRNRDTDYMLGPSLGRLHRLPSSLLLYMTWFTNRVLPTDPRVSPLRDDLSGLPPVLVHASEAEMLLGDAQRYVKRSQSQGSPAELRTWPHMVHVWHLFQPRLPEANQAFEDISRFLQPHLDTGESN